MREKKTFTPSRFFALAATGTLLASLTTGCPQATDATRAAITNTITGGGTSSSVDYTSYYNAKTTKVMFSKKFFSNNATPSSLSCAGDAASYFDPLADRAVPAKPSWLRNISVELTNSNSPYGSSNAFLCSLASNSSTLPSACLGPAPPPGCSNAPPPPSNCAAFDDRQSLTGYQTKAYIIGGFNCENAASGTGDVTTCSTQTSSTWTLTLNSTTGLASPYTAMTFSRSSTLALPTSTNLLYSRWAYDNLHDWLIGYGGVDSSGTLSSAIVRLYQKPYPGSTSDPSTPGIESVAAGYVNTTSVGLAGMRKVAGATMDMTDPAKRVGHTLTYIPRRHPSLARKKALNGAASCQVGATAFTDCIRTTLPTSVTDEGAWQDGDYFLITGGAMGSTYFSSDVVALSPHRISTIRNSSDVGGTQAYNAFDWEWLNNRKWLDADVSAVTVQPVVRLSLDGSIPTAGAAGWAYRDRFSRGTNSVLPARAFHRAIYDSWRDRVYIFGGLITTNNNDSITTIATTSDTTSYYTQVTSGAGTTIAPTSETWILDLPGPGKRPTLACQVTRSPILNSGSLPGLLVAPGTAASLVNFSSFDVSALEYEQSSTVFPPGGCMQYAQPVTATLNTDSTADDGGSYSPNSSATTNYTQPTMRFEQAMAFDDNQGVVFMFGGCKTAPSVLANGIKGSSAPYYDALANCNTRTTLLNDTWVYLPPETTESALVTTLGSTSSQYTFGRPDFLSPLDPLLHGFPLFYTSPTNTTGTSTLSSTELRARTNGTWIKLVSDDASTETSTTQPPARASAAFWYDQSHGKFYLFGGKVCNVSPCTYAHDLWEYTPPSISTCDRTAASCTATGTWRRIDNAPTNIYSTTNTAGTYPAAVVAPAAVMATRAPGDYNHYNDGFYTVSDNACSGQGPVLGSDSTSRESVGAIYVDIDRSSFSSTENLLINLKLLPFAASTYASDGVDNNDGTKLPGYHFNGTYGSTTVDDRDAATSTDTAYIRVSFLSNPLRDSSVIMSQSQPRYHTYQPPGTPIIAEEFDIASSGTGQPLEKQIFVPLSLDSRINLIKIERVRGSVKFFDMIVSRF